jgi:HK97 gp10 family phage protein
VKTGVTITGIADVNRILAQIAPREAKNLMRATVQDLAAQVAKSAKANAPADEGDLKAGIKAKRQRGSRDIVASAVGVYGTAWYWRFLEYGQGPDGVEHAFFLKALQAIRPDIDRVYLEAFVGKLEARLARLAKRSGG